jgi:hypothetical protein
MSIEDLKDLREWIVENFITKASLKVIIPICVIWVGACITYAITTSSAVANNTSTIATHTATLAEHTRRIDTYDQTALDISKKLDLLIALMNDENKTIYKLDKATK